MQLQQDFLQQESTEFVSYKDFLIGSLSGKVVMDDTLAEHLLIFSKITVSDLCNYHRSSR